MLPDVTHSLGWLEQHPDILDNIGRGIEREALRVQSDGQLSQQAHPAVLGSALTHKWIITDFAEALMEFVTPVDHDIPHLLTLLRDLHRYVARNLGTEQLWPLSMPTAIDDPERIQLADYGQSNLGQMKHIYRQGLKHRYGAMMQAIAGIHYNFSLPERFWQAWQSYQASQQRPGDQSAGYLRLIRNYYRFGWIIPYLFGASPAFSDTFLTEPQGLPDLQRDDKGSCWLPYATSLRLSDVGYTSHAQSALSLNFNSLEQYISGVKQGVRTPSPEYEALGINNGKGQRIQLNSNILQNENELYAPIRPKRVPQSGEAPSDALLRGGIEYIEVRSLDVNPFSAVGINQQQVRFLDTFLIWCTIAESPELSAEQLAGHKRNWNRVVREGRKPGLTLQDEHGEEFELKRLAEGLFADLERIAVLLDQGEQGDYQQNCQQLRLMVADPELTYSGQLLKQIRVQGFIATGNQLAAQYQQQLSHEALEIIPEAEFIEQAESSRLKQREIESLDKLSLAEFLASHNG